MDGAVNIEALGGYAVANERDKEGQGRSGRGTYGGEEERVKTFYNSSWPCEKCTWYARSCALCTGTYGMLVRWLKLFLCLLPLDWGGRVVCAGGTVQTDKQTRELQQTRCQHTPGVCCACTCVVVFVC